MSDRQTSLVIGGPEDFARNFAVSRETIERLSLYAELLKRWQKAVNLVAPSTLDSLWLRHFADSAQLLALAPWARKWVDLGSGGGFPGLVIAILLTNRNDCMVHLIEANGRKCAFLHEVARRVGAPVEIDQGRIEEIARAGKVGHADVVTARALAPLGPLLGLAGGFFAPHTVGLFLKGREARQEIEDAQGQWRFRWTMRPSRTGGQGQIIEISDVDLTGGMKL